MIEALKIMKEVRKVGPFCLHGHPMRNPRIERRGYKVCRTCARLCMRRFRAKTRTEAM